MKHTWKKATAGLLAMALVVGTVPANVGTGGLFGGAAIVASAATTVTTIDQLMNASGSVVIGADIEYSEYDFWFYYNDVDIDLNGHTITLPQAYFGTYEDLTIRDSKGGGKILMLEDGVRVPGGNLILEGGTLESNSEHGPIDVYGGTFTMNGGTITGQKSIWREEGSVIINGGNVNGEFDETETSLSITGGIFNFDVTSLVDAGVSVTKIDNLWYVGDSAPSIVGLSNASVTLGDDLALNFYVDGIADETAAAEYTVNFTGACVDESSALTYNAAVGKYYATTHVYAKDIDKNITATLCKGDETVDTLADYSISQYLTAAESEADEKTSALITATKDFGNASSEYFYGTGSGYSDGFASYAPDATAYAPNFDSDAAKLSLVLDSKTAARLYVKGDTTGTESTISSTKADYPTYHEITGLLPQNLADEQTITVGGTDYTFSALTWCYRVLNNTSASQKNINMAKAIMAYYEAAKNYSSVDVSSVTLDKSTLTLTAGGDTATLTASVLPDNATDKTVTWSSDNEAVATVANGVVTPVGAGTATITAAAGGKSATCNVTVNAIKYLSQITAMPDSFDDDYILSLDTSRHPGNNVQDISYNDAKALADYMAAQTGKTVAVMYESRSYYLWCAVSNSNDRKPLDGRDTGTYKFYYVSKQS